MAGWAEVDRMGSVSGKGSVGALLGVLARRGGMRESRRERNVV